MFSCRFFWRNLCARFAKNIVFSWMSLRCAILVFIGKSLLRLISWAVFCLILSSSNKENTSIGKFCSTMLPVFRVIHPALMPIYLVHETEIVLFVNPAFFAITVEYTSRESPSVWFVWESRASCSIWGVSISCAMNCFWSAILQYNFWFHVAQLFFDCQISLRDSSCIWMKSGREPWFSRIGDGGLKQFIVATYFVLHHSGSTSEPDAFLPMLCNMTLIDRSPTPLDVQCSTHVKCSI